MGTFITNLYKKYKNTDIAVQLICWNVGLFIFVTIVELFLKLFGADNEALLNVLALPASLSQFLLQPWSIVTYMFMHTDMWHILFNMLCLYWFGKFFLDFFSSKHLRGLYILGGLTGGVFFMAAYNVFPFFQDYIDTTILLGASASALAIVFATAFRAPNYMVNFFIVQVRLKYLALIAVAVDLLFITSSNAGGHIAHLGGACAGLAFAACLKRGTDLTAWINVVIDFLAGLFRCQTWHRHPKMKVHYSSKPKTDEEYNARKKQQNEELDRILDKLKKSGYAGLTVEEKKYLFDASKK